MKTKKKTKKIVKKKNKKRKLRYGRIILCILIVFFFLYLIINVFKFPVKNIYIYGNSELTDQEIIDLAGIHNYPSIFSITTKSMERKLKKNIYIEKVVVKKKKLSEIHIEIKENYALFYYESENKTIMHNLAEINEKLAAPLVVNYITDNVYELFKEKMQKIDINILKRISEIKYDPNNVDSERFIFTMNDGNYVYLTLEKFESINNYVDIIKNFDNKKGILYLDSGEYFKVF